MCDVPLRPWFPRNAFSERTISTLRDALKPPKISTMPPVRNAPIEIGVPLVALAGVNFGLHRDFGITGLLNFLR
jgi:hypothetical protein